MFSLGIYQQEQDSIITMNMSYLPLYMLVVIEFILAIFTTVLARWRPKGPLPAAWGALADASRFGGRLGRRERGCIVLG
jgi:hypothetical protein